VAKATGKPDIDIFFRMMEEYALEIPDCITRAIDKQVLHMNNLLGLYDLNIDLVFPIHNPQSLKMKGMMSMAAQRVSGTFLLPEGLERLTEAENEILRQIT
jgi:lantibiotic modifying enzyme